jgi:FtsZ-binding cell division protein ZapB
MDTIRNESMIKLALDTIDLVILRWQVDEAMSSNAVNRQEYYRLTRARDLLAECNTTVVLQ